MPNLTDRFLSFVDKGTNESVVCWEWTGGKRRGYGQFCLDGRMVGAHRASYMLFVNDIPEGMCVCHRCDNPGCVRPSHLFLGTHADNMHDMYGKGRRQNARGEAHHSAKLSEHDVDVLRFLYCKSRFRLRTLCAVFGVSEVAIRNIIIGKTWGRDPLPVRKPRRAHA